MKSSRMNYFHQRPIHFDGVRKHKKVSTNMVTSCMKLLLLLASLCNAVSGQVIGQDLCSCAPSTYEFTLDFSLFCPPVNITQGDAVQSTTCLINPFLDPAVADLIPVSVQSIDIIEINQNERVIVRESIEGSFGDGDTFMYTSIAADPSQIVDPVDVPRAIQINIIGVNQFDEPIINLFIVVFTNDCQAFPVFFEGQSAGWVRFSDLGPPRLELCPFGERPTDSPTIAPVLPPSDAPTMGPTSSPSNPPTDEPTLPPTIPSTDAPTPVTPAPTDVPTLSPSFDMSMSFSMSMSMDMGMDFDMDLDLMDSLDGMMEFGRKRSHKSKQKMKSSGSYLGSLDLESDDMGTKASKSSKNSGNSSKSTKTAKVPSASSKKTSKSSKGAKSGGNESEDNNNSTKSAKAGKSIKSSKSTNSNISSNDETNSAKSGDSTGSSKVSKSKNGSSKGTKSSKSNAGSEKSSKGAKSSKGGKGNSGLVKSTKSSKSVKGEGCNNSDDEGCSQEETMKMKKGKENSAKMKLKEKSTLRPTLPPALDSEDMEMMTGTAAPGASPSGGLRKDGPNRLRV